VLSGQTDVAGALAAVQKDADAQAARKGATP
jgi:hypothetical protein